MNGLLSYPSCERFSLIAPLRPLVRLLLSDLRPRPDQPERATGELCPYRLVATDAVGSRWGELENYFRHSV